MEAFNHALSLAGFGFVVALTILGGVLAVIPRSLIHNVYGLALSLAGVAGLYVYLGSGFLAVMQILIYIGGICVTIVFAIMLAEPMRLQFAPRNAPKVAWAFWATVAVTAGFGMAIYRLDLPPLVKPGGDWSIKRVGALLFTNYEFMFELISLILLLAIIGAIITAAVLKPVHKRGLGR